MSPTRLHRNRRRLILIGVACYVVLACVMNQPRTVARNTWWEGLGPVLPHDSFPADCALCHIGQNWQNVRGDFDFDHEAETGVPLLGAHDQARCLRCHNDRGPVATFTKQGCAGCHEDVHFGRLGPDCTSCHQENTWIPVGQIEMHSRTRFPLTGVHVATSCWQCHPGAEVGFFSPTDSECVTCHRDDLDRANNPNHAALGWVDNCDRCHIPTTFKQAELDQ